MNDLQLTSTFCIVDDFCKKFIPLYERTLIESGTVKRRRKDCLSVSEIMYILLWFYDSGMSCFKHFFANHYNILSLYFPRIRRYNSFIDSQKKAFIPMIFFIKYLISQSKHTGIYYVDSTPLPVCHNRRIYKHKTFRGLANRGKTSMGWFYGFKLHFIINDRGEICSFNITSGNVSDISQVEHLTKDLSNSGTLFGDKGYLSKKLEELLQVTKDLHLITKCRRNMKNNDKKQISNTNKLLLSKRGIVETIFGKLKDYTHLVHTKYRSITGFFLNVLSSLCSYQLNPKKPKVNIGGVMVS